MDKKQCWDLADDGEGVQMGPGLKMRSESRKAELRSGGDSSEEDTF